jgi:hypothetical protein
MAVTAYFIYKKAKSDSEAHAQVQDAGTPDITTISTTISPGLFSVNPLPVGANDVNWSYWRTDVSPLFQPLVDQFNAYNPYNLNPIYTKIGEVGGNQGFYETQPAQAYYYNATRTPDFLLPQSAQNNIYQTRYEQALYGNLSHSWDLTSPYQR